jgi:hypothetical protein
MASTSSSILLSALPSRMLDLRQEICVYDVWLFVRVRLYVTLLLTDKLNIETIDTSVSCWTGKLNLTVYDTYFSLFIFSKNMWCLTRMDTSCVNLMWLVRPGPGTNGRMELSLNPLVVCIPRYFLLFFLQTWTTIFRCIQSAWSASKSKTELLVYLSS